LPLTAPTSLASTRPPDDEYKHETELRIEIASWDADDSRLQIRGSGAEDEAIDAVLPISGEASCKNCHGSPLDVPDNPDPAANVRVQRIHAFNSRVMHYSHGQTGVFPTMPAPMAQEDPRTGLPLNHRERIGLLEERCCQCCPGSRTKYLRGAMADGGMVCQDCHGGSGD
jgi:hypothetical protein